MKYARQLQLGHLFIYSIVASIGSKFLDIHFIHILNVLILSAILYHILEWKYDWVDKEKGENDESN